MTRPVHAAKHGLTGDHRTDGLRCRCDPWQLVDINEPGRLVLVHRPFDEDALRVGGRSLTGLYTLLRNPRTRSGSDPLATADPGVTS